MDEEARARAIARMERRLAELLGEGEDDSHQELNEPSPESEEVEWVPAHLACSDEVIEAVVEAMEIEAQLCGDMPIDWDKWGDI
jgi:3-hydroxyacyl-CoA dehydrogenase